MFNYEGINAGTSSDTQDRFVSSWLASLVRDRDSNIVAHTSAVYKHGASENLKNKICFSSLTSLVKIYMIIEPRSVIDETSLSYSWGNLGYFI